MAKRTLVIYEFDDIRAMSIEQLAALFNGRMTGAVTTQNMLLDGNRLYELSVDVVAEVVSPSHTFTRVSLDLGDFLSRPLKWPLEGEDRR